MSLAFHFCRNGPVSIGSIPDGRFRFGAAISLLKTGTTADIEEQLDEQLLGITLDDVP
jgi:hypothetical protein